MKVNRKNAKRDGLTDQEIAFLESYLARHRVNTRAALVVLGGQPRWVCESVAEALDQLRPGCWQHQFSEQCHQSATAVSHAEADYLPGLLDREDKDERKKNRAICRFCGTVFDGDSCPHGCNRGERR